jgi:hypothetical protein
MTGKPEIIPGQKSASRQQLPTGDKRVSQDLFGVTTPNVRNRTLAIRESPTRWMSESA